MADRGGRRIEPLPRKSGEKDKAEAIEEAIPRLPTNAIVAEAPPRLPSSAFVGDDADAPQVIDPSVLDDPSRMPSAVFVPQASSTAPAPSAKATPRTTARPPRAAYVPPRLGQPMPRALRHTHPVSALISQWINSLVRTLRGMHMYADNNARRREYFDQTVAQLEQILAEVPDLELDIREDRIFAGADVVHFSPDPVEGLSNILFSNGLRRVRLTRGIARIEILRLLGVLATDFSRPESANEDLFSILSRLALPHVRATGTEPVAPPQKAAPPKSAEPKSPPPPKSPPAKAPPREPPARTPPPQVVIATPDVVLEETRPQRPRKDAGQALSEAAALPVPSNRPIEQITEPSLVSAAKLLESAGFDPFAGDDEVTFVPPKPAAPMRAPEPSILPDPPKANPPKANPPKANPPKANPPKPNPPEASAFAEEDESTVLCDSATARALSALIREESMPQPSISEPAKPAPIDPRSFDEDDDGAETTHDTLPGMASPFAGLDDVPMPEIASDLILDPKPKK